ncbi:MAG TPA: C4-type zinc ribbon domain-containing protein [Vicinamibacterales bacterium]|nr:C4-type zinc ribbon domain-containing protein [Vicinamibacterales bacterium]
MHADLQNLIKLQDLDLAVERFRRRLAELPSAQTALEERLAARGASVARVKERLAANQTARREIEKELAIVQSRLSKYKDQLMEVKTNKEYQAMQTEIAVADQQVRAHEDRLLDRMEETENLAAELKAEEAALKTDQTEVATTRQQLEEEGRRLQHDIEATTVERATVATQLAPQALALFEHVSRHRRGVALSEARDGHCTQCHVRLRPQVFNEVRRNDGLIQCDSCSRILYFVPGPPAGVSPAVS